MNKYWFLGATILALVALVAYFALTDNHIPANEPAWVRDLIAEQINGPVANPPALLSKCTYKDQIVYYLPPRCCDVPSELFDSQGQRICSPDGGYTGSGDGKCPDFSTEGCDIIWKDSR